ncbi:alpha/beta hydrolase [Mycobacterium sp. Y57]|uniref:alpha/beta fold hydrolase n=1 Tax=Mycolicibacterium xanthum TaxID=2796469 RepID=UPI001C84A200|nr:alpha/beta hydrolase [Mycolicibacterium xanthum]MBX7434208.1 alpha/beta hydrolase [Mycolicibacterium xanthum]
MNIHINDSRNAALHTPPRPDWLPEPVWPFDLHELDLDGRRLVYTDTGGDGPVVLMVHVGLWSLLWKGLITELAPRFRCVTLDVPGSGLSGTAPASLAAASDAIGRFIDHLGLHDVTLVVHDTGGWAAMAAIGDNCSRSEGISKVVAVNTFGWRPRGVLRLALRIMGSAVMRELMVWTGFMAWGSATRFGVGRHFDRPTRRAWRRGLRSHARRRFLHRMFTDAANDGAVSLAAERGIEALADRPTMTVFGQFGDYFFFRRGWRRIRPAVIEVTVPWGVHFPQSDNPALVAGAISDWHRGA